MRSSTQNGLTLLEFIEFFPKIHPFRMAQIAYGSDVNDDILTPFPARMATEAVQCRPCTFEFGWQDNALSREDINNAIGLAESLWAEKTHFWPVPKYITGEEVLLEGGDDINAAWEDCCLPDGTYGKMARLQYGYVEAIGVELLTSLGTIAVEVFDREGDTIPESFITTEPFPVPDCTKPCEIAAFFTEEDRLDYPLEEWEIRPLRVTIDESGGTGNWTATIQGPSYLLVRPEWVLAVKPECLFARELDTYVSEIEVYRRTTDPDQSGELKWLDGCSNPMKVACSGDIWQKQGLISLQALSPQPTVTGLCVPIPVSATCRQLAQTKFPERGLVNYRAGFPRQKNCRMNRDIAYAIAHLAAALMPCKLCGCACNGAEDVFEIYRSVRLYGEKKDLFVESARQIDNPFGPQHGALIAWEKARVRKLTDFATII